MWKKEFLISYNIFNFFIIMIFEKLIYVRVGVCVCIYAYVNGHMHTHTHTVCSDYFLIFNMYTVCMHICVYVYTT